MNSQDILLKEIIGIKMKLRSLSIEHWLNNELFTWVWWLYIAVIVISVIVWLRYVNRKRIMEITLFGLLIAAAAIFLDIAGSEYPYWEYPIRLLPITPLIFPVDFIFLPIVDMYIYQKYPGWKNFLIANIIAAAILSFIFEPLLTLFKAYHLVTWKYTYSFPIYILIAVICKSIVQKMCQICTWYNG